MNLRTTFVALAAAALVLSAGPARAQQGAGTVYSKERYPVSRLVDRPLTLAQGLLQVDLPLRIELSQDRVGEPISIPAAASFGLTDGIEVGVFHAVGLCLTGRSRGCREVYDDVGGRARVSLLRDPGSQLVLDGGLFGSRFRNTVWQGLVGLGYKRTLGPPAAVVVRADLAVFLNDRDRQFFRELLALSVEGQYQLATGLAAFARLGAEIPIQEASTVDVPVSAPVAVGVELAPLRGAAIGAELRFPNLVGEEATSDARLGLVYLRFFL